MTNPTTMLSFIQRILQSPSNSSRKRKRSNAFTTEHATSSEIEDLRNTIAENDFNPYPGASASSEDREKAISEFLGCGEQDAELDPASKRVRQGENENESGSSGNQSGKAKESGRLSTISERREEEMNQNENAGGQRGYDEKRCGDGNSGDEKMVDIDLGLHPQTIHEVESSMDGMVGDQDLWMWKGGNIMQR